MQVQDLKCQIAQAQITRYLGGEQFDPESLRQLNEHIAVCERCKSVIANRRAELQGKITEPVAAASPEVATPQHRKTATPSRQVKSLVYVGALALVLGAMSFVANDPTSVFGQRASQPITEKSAETASLHTPKPSTPPIESAAAAGNEPLQVPVGNLAPTNGKNPRSLGGPVGSINKDGEPNVTVYPPSSAIAKAVTSTPANRKPQAANRQPARKRPARKISTPAPRPSSRIVIYDSEGNVIHPEGN